MFVRYLLLSTCFSVLFQCCASIIMMFSLIGCIEAVTFEVKEGNSTCIKAELSASFSITYNTSNSTVCTAVFWFPTVPYSPQLFTSAVSPCEHQSYRSSFLRVQCRSLCLTPPQSTQAGAPVAQTAAHRGWWRCLDPATHWG